MQCTRQAAIIVPTLNEVASVDGVIESALDASREDGLEIEILVADGGSTDGTRDHVRRWSTAAPVRLVECDGSRGLAGDVVEAARTTDAEVVVLMDGDGSHPAEVAPQLVRRLDEGYDMVIGSRYVEGGRTPGWPMTRRVGSRAAALAARTVTTTRDPLAGFFAVRRQALIDYGADARGFKLGFEVLTRSGTAFRVDEVPIVFVDRRNGRSKMSAGQVVRYARQLVAAQRRMLTAWHAPRPRPTAR